jgi:hypothetical protein
MKIGMKVSHPSAGDDTGNEGNVSALGPDGRVRVTWSRHPLAGAHSARLKVWYTAEDAKRFLKAVVKA